MTVDSFLAQNLPILVTLAAFALVAAAVFTGLLVFRPRSDSAMALRDRLGEMETALSRTGREQRQEAEERGRELRSELRDQIGGVGTGLQSGMELTRGAVEQRMADFARAQNEAALALRAEIGKAVVSFGESLKGDIRAAMARLDVAQAGFQASTREALAGVEQRVAALTEGNAAKQDALRTAVEERLEALRAGNDAKLEQMRATVDEKLQGTLEKRLGESFALVSERLENVQRGLGEMQTLATGVGDLKRVLTNVKTRGGWAEVQLGMLLEDMMAPGQYASNVAVREGSQERVEFAVRLPGGDADGGVLLPIDAKFPAEDYERLMEAQSRGDLEAVEQAARGVEARIRAEARKIREKYVNPPRTCDFALLYLPTEGLYAEVLRRGSLHADIQRDHRVIVVGPTTLSAILTSLQMGFKTLAIQKRTSEAWTVLGEAKTAFEKYGAVWEKLKGQLDRAQNTVDEARKKTKAVARSLTAVETLPFGPAEPTAPVIPGLGLDLDDED